MPKTKFKIKSNNKANPWITKGILKSSKPKQKLYEEFLKNRSIQNEKIYKNYRKLFEKIIMKSKRKYYSEKFLQFQGDAKKTWRIMKEVIGKFKLIYSTFPRKTVINKNVIYEERHIANAFNNFFINIGPKLADDIPTTTRSFESYVQNTNQTIKEEPITINELKDAFFSLKINKSAGYDEISFNVIKNCFGELCDPLKYIFNLSFEKGIFPDRMKIAKVTPDFKRGDSADLSNYRPISALSCFSKILERLYNRLYKHLSNSKILYPKQFGFQKGHSTDHALLQLIMHRYIF